MINVETIVVAALTMTAVVVTFLLTRRNDQTPASLGAVSDQWIAEHRSNSVQDGRR